jgi:AcrR family transcriptional regulator
MDPRQRLLEAAIGCLQERGYARTGTRDIVAAAGSHLPAVNYYFGSKDRLLQEAIVEALRRWTVTTLGDAEQPAHGCPRERLFHSVRRFLATLERDRPYVIAAVEAFAQAERREELRARLAEVYAELRREVASRLEAALAADGAGHRPEANSLASILIALFDGLAVQWLLDPESTPDAEQTTRALDVLATALTVERGAGQR